MKLLPPLLFVELNCLSFYLNYTITPEFVPCYNYNNSHIILLLKPVIYFYPKEPIDISVQLNLKESKFTTVYPKFNGINTWNVHAEPRYFNKRKDISIFILGS